LARTVLRRDANWGGRPDTTRMPSESGPKAERSVAWGIGVEEWSEEREMVVGEAVLVGAMVRAVLVVFEERVGESWYGSPEKTRDLVSGQWVCSGCGRRLAASKLLQVYI
jgi:hypothetical protein